MTALLVLMVAIGAIWLYLPRATVEVKNMPVAYVQDSPLEIAYASTTGRYRGTLLTENCNVITAAMLPAGTSPIRYTLAITIERQAFCTATGAVPHAFSATAQDGALAGVTINAAIVPHTLLSL